LTKPVNSVPFRQLPYQQQLFGSVCICIFALIKAVKLVPFSAAALSTAALASASAFALATASAAAFASAAALASPADV
jgi:hypothetical protein